MAGMHDTGTGRDNKECTVMNGPLISVVVPVYKVEEYLDYCVQSIVAQTYANLEIILVDDGSPDRCGEMCDEWAKKDSRIKVLHLQNGGQARARNKGIGLATGEYVSFVDSDDVIDKKMVEKLLALIKEYDAQIAVCGLRKIKGKNDFFPANSLPSVVKYPGEQATERLLYQKGLETGPCAKLVLTEIVRQHPFPEGRLFEDLAIVYRWFYEAEYVVVSSDILYGYIQRENSVMHRVFSSLVFDEVLAADGIVDFVSECCPELLPAANARRFSAYSQVIKWMPNHLQEQALQKRQAMLWSFIKSYRWKMMLDNKARVKNRVAAALTLLGMRFYQRL